ncbi:hypothetical protein [Vibrio sp. V08_P9A1T1]|uniref:hypothetical protein n=1 Tax=Vibrio sp. V08_P9A1T1 TaxID=1938663 RepID=UPI000B8E2549|nr:hypothetical protein [Vibrio sp. V08_P9A1T1]OXX29109.1 hypothetical protein B9J92_02450 [Vibrio sp. V08_P9A1T1]
MIFSKEIIKAFDQLISFNKAMTDSLIDDGFEKYYSAKEFVHHFGTINLYCGRQVGSSSLIRNRANKNDLVVVHSDDAKKFFENCKAKVVKSEDLGEEEVFNNIYIDLPFYCQELTVSYIFDNLIKNHRQKVIMLGAHF